MRSKVLCIAPYSNYHPLHGLWEMTVLNGLRVRGAEVAYYLCDALSHRCDLFRFAPGDQDCRACMDRSEGLAKSMGFSPGWLGSVLSPDDFARAERFAAAQPVGGFFEARDEDYEIGQWMRSSVHTYFREADLQQNDVHVADCCRAYLRAGLLYALACDRIMDAFAPDALVLFNARLVFVKVAAEVAAKRGVPYYSHERGWLPERLSVNRDDIPMSRAYFDAMWGLWGDIPLNRAELKTINTVLRNREQGRDLNWIAYSPPPEAASNLRTQLVIPEGRRIWGLFTSSEDEVVSVPNYRHGAFSSQSEWVLRTLLLVQRRPDIHLVVRVHPNTGGSRSGGMSRATLHFFEVLKAHLPAGVTLVSPDDPVSTYDLMAAAEVGLVYISTCGLEMACRGKPVICASQAYYGASGVAETVQNPEHYDDLLDRLADTPPSLSGEAMQRAHRFLHAAFFRADIPFPLVSMPNPYTGTLAYASLAELDPGRDPGLDAVCRMILEGTPVLPEPSPEDRARTDHDEREWFGIEGTAQSGPKAK